jgi:phage baseplate assembly protein W
MDRYKDIDFQLTPILDTTNTDVIVDVNTLNDLYDINQSIKNIILTAPGERPFYSGGAALYDFKFEKIIPTDLILLSQKISALLTIEEPRINIISINIQQITPGSLEVVVTYSPKWDPDLRKTKSVTI